MSFNFEIMLTMASHSMVNHLHNRCYQRQKKCPDKHQTYILGMPGHIFNLTGKNVTRIT